VKPIFLSLLSRVVVIAAQLAYVKIYSNSLSSHELGLYYFFITSSYSINAFFLVPLDYYQQSKLYKFISDQVSFKSLYWVFACICGLSVLMQLVQPSYVVFTVMAGLLAVFIYLGNAFKGVLNNLENQGYVAVVMALEALLKVGVFYCFLMVMPGKATTLIGSAILALFITLIPLVFAARKLKNFRSGRIINIDTVDVFRFALPISIGAVLNWLQLQGYRMVLVPFGYAEMVGIYATVSGIGNAGMGAAAAVYGQIFIPRIYKTNGIYTKTYIRNALLLSFAILCFCALLSGLIVEVLTKHDFRQYSFLILYGVAAEAGNFLIGAISTHLTIANETKKLLVASAAGLATMIICFGFLYLFWEINIYTIGLPIVSSQLMAAIAIYLAARRTQGFLKGRDNVEISS